MKDENPLSTPCKRCGKPGERWLKFISSKHMSLVWLCGPCFEECRKLYQDFLKWEKKDQ